MVIIIGFLDWVALIMNDVCEQSGKLWDGRRVDLLTDV